jgi:hypothetical protein
MTTNVCRRLEAIGAHNGATRRDMGKLHVLSFAGRDAILGYPDRDDRIRRTPLFEQLRREALRIRPRLIVLDTAADVLPAKRSTARTPDNSSPPPGPGPPML